ncbi:MAG: putative DNA modification/repair radical SAM protein [Lachnospiraceae bacterium]|nr:putative DNA modification/repair radical SAM protein [Lachnospiraceae bacterium]
MEIIKKEFFAEDNSILEQAKNVPYDDGVILRDVSYKLKILTDAAKYDVACTSSGVTRKGNGKTMGNAAACGICHAFAADGICISLLKILMSNECVFDCKYCINRSSNDVPRATFTPDEICKLTMEFYRRNYIEGLFLSSGVIKNPNYTMELMYEVVRRLRVDHGFNGYIHIKAIPGAAQELVEAIGYLADRMSINLEMPTGEGLKEMAPHKTRNTILKPMKQIQTGIFNNRLSHGITDKKSAMQMRNYGDDLYESALSSKLLAGESKVISENRNNDFIIGTRGKYFVPAGQSTQMIVGATKESDYHIINVAEALYKNYDLKRVFYSAYIPINDDSALPALDVKPPLLREHRLYQADFLLRFYGFKASELLTEERPFFNENIDPKCDWAVRHLEHFPVEINQADIAVLLRVPGIGVKSARRIVQARRLGVIDFGDLKKMGVVLKRALYFITCKGKMMYDTKLEESYIVNHLIYNEPPHKAVGQAEANYSQMSLFDYYGKEMYGDNYIFDNHFVTNSKATMGGGV